MSLDWDLQFDQAQQQLNLRLSGSLGIKHIAKFWRDACQAQAEHHPKNITIDATAVTYCDSAGASLLLTLKEKQHEAEHAFHLTGLDPSFGALIEVLERLPAAEKSTLPARLNFIEKVGQGVVNIGRNFYENLVFLGELMQVLWSTLRQPNVIRWKTVWREIENAGPNALPIILLLGFLLGLILSFQSAIPLMRFGAVIYIINLVGISLTRELGPLMVAIILAGRTASSFAAVLGTMKINQEIDALKTMGLRPLVFLVIPRIIATTLMSPILTVFMVLIAILGCFLFMWSLGYSWDVFYRQINAAVKLGDLWQGLFKSAVFGLLIAGIGCKHGLNTRFGASAVGDSTTQAVVSCIITIVIVDGLFAVLFYLMGM